MEVLERNSDSSTYVLATLTKVMSIGTYWVKSRPCAARGATEASFAQDSVAKTMSSASPRHLVVESMESSKSRPVVFPGILYRNSCHACHKERVKEKNYQKKTAAEGLIHKRSEVKAGISLRCNEGISGYDPKTVYLAGN